MGIKDVHVDGEPLAYFLTWSRYGTWLPGDQRGWVDGRGHIREPDQELNDRTRRLMSEPAITLTTPQRKLVEQTISDHCRIRGWELHAVNCRTTHVHAVVNAPGETPDEVMNQLKAWCTRRLKEQLHSKRQHWWTVGGSTRWINDQNSHDEVTHYTAECQDGPKV